MPRWFKNTISTTLLAYVASMPAALYLAVNYPPRSLGRLAFIIVAVVGIIPASISIFWFGFLYRSTTEAMGQWVIDHRSFVFGAVVISAIVTLLGHAVH